MINALVVIAMLSMLICAVQLISVVVSIVKRHNFKPALAYACLSAVVATGCIMTARVISPARTAENPAPAQEEKAPAVEEVKEEEPPAPAAEDVKSEPAQEAKKEEKPAPAQEVKQEEPKQVMKSAEEYEELVSELISELISEDDKIDSVAIDAEKGIIDIVLTLGDPAPVPYEDAAKSRVSSIMDELVMDSAIQIIRIKFKDGGSVELSTSDAKTNGYGLKYIPLEVIDKNFKY